MKPKTIAQFVLPIFNQTGRRNDQDSVRFAAGVQLSKEHAGLNRFSQTDFIGDEHPPLGHLD